MNNLCADIGWKSINHDGEQLCGDHVDIINQGENSMVIVLADGLGSGVKANILSTLTTTMLTTMLKGNVPIDECVTTVAETLPMCRERKLAYATFTILQTAGTRARLIQYDNPNVILIRDNEPYSYPTQELNISGKKILRSELSLQENDVLIAMSEELSTLAWRLDIPIVKAGTESAAVPTGTGPYVFTKTDSGAYLETSPSWWRQETLPLQRIELQHCKDRDTMLYAFSSREIQLLPLDLTGTGASGVSGSGDYTDAPTTAMQFLGFNTRRAPFNDEALRQAVSCAVDRQGLVDSCLLGHGSAAQFPVSPASDRYPTTLARTYSTLALQQLTAAEDTSPEDTAAESAGKYAGTEVTLLVNEENSFKVAAAQELAYTLSRCGLSVTVDAVPWETYLQRLWDGRFDLYYGECRLTADWDIRALVGTEGSLNYGGFSDEKTDALLEACRTADESARGAALLSLWEELDKQVPIAPLCFKADSVVTTTGLVDGMTVTETDPFFTLEQWVVHLDKPSKTK